MNVIKLRNRKIKRAQQNSPGIPYHEHMWVNCNIRKVSTETHCCVLDHADHITATEKPKYQKINYITITAFCGSCNECMKNDKIKTINKGEYIPIETENMPLEQRGTVHYKNRLEKWVIDILEGRKRYHGK